MLIFFPVSSFSLSAYESSILFIENKNHLKIWDQIKDNCPTVKQIISIETIAHDLVHYSWKEFLGLNPTDPVFKQRCKSIDPQKMCTIVYTSGTTGEPKGAMLSHVQIISEVSEAFQICGVATTDVSLSFLPYAHILGRIEHWGHAYWGFCLAYAESIEKIKSNLLEIRPTIMVAVPRIFEKIHSSILTQIETQVWLKKIFTWALKISDEVFHYQMTRQPLPLKLLGEYELSKRLVFNRIKKAFGGRLRFAISGGAPLSPEISRFFHSAQILILEGYGLSETTAAITVNTPFNYKFGSVGRPIGDVQIRLAEDGEVCIKSKKIMLGYYKNPQATAAALEDGWFKTGDIGEILSGGDLKLTDRKKDLIKTSGGKYVAPQKLEGLLSSNPLISHVLIHGDQKKYIVALITLDHANTKQWAAENGLEKISWEDLVHHPKLLDSIRHTVAHVNSQLASFETIKKYHILPQEFTVAGGELTPSLKVKRKFLDAKLKKEIEALY
ncbi:MAG: AMP-dependent synthetase/ligase [Pseudobdellovibrionaceae bacterium]